MIWYYHLVTCSKVSYRLEALETIWCYLLKIWLLSMVPFNASYQKSVMTMFWELWCIYIFAYLQAFNVDLKAFQKFDSFY